MLLIITGNTGSFFFLFFSKKHTHTFMTTTIVQTCFFMSNGFVGVSSPSSRGTTLRSWWKESTNGTEPESTRTNLEKLTSWEGIFDLRAVWFACFQLLSCLCFLLFGCDLICVFNQQAYWGLCDAHDFGGSDDSFWILPVHQELKEKKGASGIDAEHVVGRRGLLRAFLFDRFFEVAQR